MADVKTHRQPTLDEAFADIARRVLNIPTLETRNMDGLDFHDVAVWQVREALEEAWRAGAASKEPPKR